jgi:transketolase
MPASLDLSKVATEIRKEVIKMITAAGSGHTAGSLGSAEIFAAFYFSILNQDPKNPDWVERDRFILSCGHYCPAQYAALAHAGYFPISELKTLRKLGSKLQGHPVRGTVPGVETTSGPLGEGLAQAAGIALGARIDGKHFRVYCLTSDGEHDSGNHWEAVMFAAKYKLANLTQIVDRNSIQIDGGTEEVMPLNSLTDKYKAFNWNVIEIDGNDITQILEAVKEAKTYYQGPTVIIAKTIPGKGVDFMENDYRWHGKAPTKEESETALNELK